MTSCNSQSVSRVNHTDTRTPSVRNWVIDEGPTLGSRTFYRLSEKSTTLFSSFLHPTAVLVNIELDLRDADAFPSYTETRSYLIDFDQPFALYLWNCPQKECIDRVRLSDYRFYTKCSINL